MIPGSVILEHLRVARSLATGLRLFLPAWHTLNHINNIIICSSTFCSIIIIVVDSSFNNFPIILKLCLWPSHYSRIILTKLLTYYSLNYADIIGASLVITYCAEYIFKMIYNKLIVPVTCILSSREAYMYTLKKNWYPIPKTSLL